MCLEAVARHNKPDTVSENAKEWVRLSASEFVRRVRHIALGLADAGVRPQDRVALISENRPEWSIADLAILSFGAITVPLYTTQAVDQIEFILKDSGARALLVSGGRVLKHARKGFENLDQLEQVIVFDRGCAGITASKTLEISKRAEQPSSRTIRTHSTS
jgi:long-chain acyl-CoA synthetase